MCVFGCVQGLSMPVIVPISGSFYQAGAVHRWENVTNYPSGISHKHTWWFKVSPENLCMCCNTHTLLHTTVWRSFRCSYTVWSLYTAKKTPKKHLHHIEPTRLRKMNTDKRQTANYKKENTLVNNKHTNLKRKRSNMAKHEWVNHESLFSVCKYTLLPWISWVLRVCLGSSVCGTSAPPAFPTSPTFYTHLLYLPKYMTYTNIPRHTNFTCQ